MSLPPVNLPFKSSQHGKEEPLSYAHCDHQILSRNKNDVHVENAKLYHTKYVKLS